MASTPSSDDHPKRKQVMCRSVWLQRQRKRARAEHHGSMVEVSPKDQPCEQGDTSEDANSTMPVLELHKLPEDILQHIHCLVPLRDARIACVSRRFLCSWRCFPNLSFSFETLGLKINDGISDLRTEVELADRINCVLENHSGIGVKTLKLNVGACRYIITARQLNRWLQGVVKSGIVELALDRLDCLQSHCGIEFNFPCSLLSCAASSLQSFSLSSCGFHPTLAIGSLRSLKNVYLTHLQITEDDLGCFLSCTISLEELGVSLCDKITLLKIPSFLQRLRVLKVFQCRKLQMILIHAPKVAEFSFTGPPLNISMSDSSQLKRMTLNGSDHFGMLQYALTKLHSIAANLQTVTLTSSEESFNLPTSPHKFLHVRRLKIYCSGSRFEQRFDFLSLVSFLEACPALEKFVLSAGRHSDLRPDSILEGSVLYRSNIRRIPEFHHNNLKNVIIIGFCSSKSLVELPCQILESSSSLERLVLDTTVGYNYNNGICGHMSKIGVEEALRGVKAIKRHVKGKVPSGVNLEVLKPCGRCHVPKL